MTLFLVLFHIVVYPDPLKSLCCCPGDFTESTLLPQGSSFLPFLHHLSTHSLFISVNITGWNPSDKSLLHCSTEPGLYLHSPLSFFTLYPTSVPQERHRGLERRARKLKIPANNGNNDASNNKSMFNKKSLLWFVFREKTMDFSHR